MRSTLTGLVILAVAVGIGWSSRDNTNESAAQTFGTLGVILVLVLIGLSFVRSGEAERVRNKGRKSSGPVKGGGTHWAKAVAQGQPGPGGRPPIPGQSSSFEVPEGLQKAIIGILILVVTVVTGYLGVLYLFPSDLAKLAEVETPKAVARGEAKLKPILDKVAERYSLERDSTDEILWNVWEANEKALVEYGLKPSSFAREVVQAAPKDAPDLEEVATKLAEEEPAVRLARLQQPRPTPGAYPQQAEFQKILDQLQKKTGIGSKSLTALLVNRWKVVYEKKKKNRNFNLMWFCRIANQRTKAGMKKAQWQAMIAKLGG